MIGYIRGTVKDFDEKSVLILCGGVGYKIFTAGGGLDSEIGTEKEYWTYLAVRENALDLYGFQDKMELTYFELLLTVSGIGPKSALNILSLANPATLYHAISESDAGYLTKTSGIGKKNAEKIVLELNEKVPPVDGAAHKESHDGDALEALLMLGYSEKDAREALKKATGDRTEERIRSALKQLQ